jgi:inhibitor of KinA sporulation pathway (predicted exonuclease)
VIQFAALAVDQARADLDDFQRFVRPLRRPLLTPFCRQLTHITQANIDGAAPMTEVWPLFERWLGQHQPRLEGWASWGDYDRKQLELEWQRHGLSSALATTPHLNLKQRFAKARRLDKPLGLNGALQLAGLQFHGQQHRALEDARNTARLLPLILPV